MTLRFWLKVFLTWLIFIPIVIINGWIRNFVYQPLLGELLAHQLSTIMAIGLWLLLVYLMLKRDLSLVNNYQLFIIGFVWLAITVVFEFGFGHYIAGHSWFKLLKDYNLSQGRLWSLFLLIIVLSPVLIKKFRAA